MALKMARPIQLKPGGPYHLKERVPIDLTKKVKGIKISLPIGDKSARVLAGEFVQVSLRTKDKAEARERHATADAALRRFWEAQRQGPKALSHKQIVGLAGELYRNLIAENEENPGEAADWLKLGLTAYMARETVINNGLGIGPVSPEKIKKRRLETLLGEQVSDFLCEKAIIVAAEDRDRIIWETSKSIEQAARHLRRNAEGDYSPDPDASKFPEWSIPQPKGQDKLSTITVAEIVKRYLAAQEGKLGVNTLKRYRPILQSLSAFTKDRIADQITSDEIYDWAVHRHSVEKVAPKTINKVDLAAVSALFKWAKGREAGRLIQNNPVVREDVRLDERGAPSPTREKALRDVEIKAILKAALAVEIDSKNPKLSFARRWCPWLAAYSGARITELTSLEKKDVRLEGKILVMDFRETKTDVPRTVPIHQHLVDLGFPEFIKSQTAGPLFFDEQKHHPSSKMSPAENCSQKLAVWIRKTTQLDKGVKPNHAWRHTWKSKALSVGIESSLRDAIAGHKDDTVARGVYEVKPVELLDRVMKIFPRYELD